MSNVDDFAEQWHMEFPMNENADRQPVPLHIPSRDLRISITSACNMECTYCHNEGQVKGSHHALSLDDLHRIVDLGVRFGAQSVRLTGGEPLLHRDICKMLRMLRLRFSLCQVGINTNAILLTHSMSDRLAGSGLDLLVVGIDRCDAVISKRSPEGVPSDRILENVAYAMSKGMVVEFAAVFDQAELEDIVRLAEWCRHMRASLKIIEVTNDRVCSETSREFVAATHVVAEHFRLAIGMDPIFEERFCVHPDGTKIRFFHSHCRIRDCERCAQMHLRVTSEGHAKPCLLRRDTERCILGADGEIALKDSLRNLGNPPECEPR